MADTHFSPHCLLYVRMTYEVAKVLLKHLSKNMKSTVLHTHVLWSSCLHLFPATPTLKKYISLLLISLQSDLLESEHSYPLPECRQGNAQELLLCSSSCSTQFSTSTAPRRTKYDRRELNFQAALSKKVISYSLHFDLNLNFGYSLTNGEKHYKLPIR